MTGINIVPGVSYHLFNDDVYVHSVDAQKDYIFTGIVFDILDYCENHKGCSVDDIYSRMSELYKVDDKEELRSDIQEFIGELINEKILCSSESPYGEEKTSDEINRELMNSFADEHKLFSLALELTYRCPEKCIHCYIDDFSEGCSVPSEKELSTDEWKSVLKQARDMGCIYVLLTGGEVLFRKDFCDIAEYAVSLGLVVNVYTTGLGLTDEVFDRLCAMKVNSVSFSLYSGVASVHDAITKVPGSFEKTLKAMLMFRSAGVNTFMKSVAMRQNLDTLYSLYELGRRLHIQVSVNPAVSPGHREKRPCVCSLGDISLYKKFFSIYARYSSSFEEALNNVEEEERKYAALLDTPPCAAGRSSLSVDPFGYLHPCIGILESCGSIREDNLQNLWNKVGSMEYRKNFIRSKLTPECSSCEYIYFCDVCIGDLLQENSGGSFDCGETLIRARARAENMKEAKKARLR